MMVSDPKTLENNSAYVDENKLKAALEAEVKYMAVEAKKIKNALGGSW